MNPTTQEDQGNGDMALNGMAAWYARLSGGGATAEDRRAFHAWLASAAENRAAYEHLKQALRVTDEVLLDESTPAQVFAIEPPLPSVRAPGTGRSQWALA